MKSLQESLFDKDLTSKNILFGQCFDIKITRHLYDYDQNEKDKKVISQIIKDLTFMPIKGLTSENLPNILSKEVQKYTNNWRGGAYHVDFYDKSGKDIKWASKADLFNDVGKITMRTEADSFQVGRYYTYFTLTRK